MQAKLGTALDVRVGSAVDGSTKIDLISFVSPETVRLKAGLTEPSNHHLLHPILPTFQLRGQASPEFFPLRDNQTWCQSNLLFLQGSIRLYLSYPFILDVFDFLLAILQDAIQIFRAPFVLTPRRRGSRPRATESCCWQSDWPEATCC